MTAVLVFVFVLVLILATMAGMSMLGDLFSSFIKRSIHLQPHDQALGLDQIPEALLPLLAVRARFNLTSGDIAILVIAFIVLELKRFWFQCRA